MRPIAVIGPTASGKTGAALELAALYGGEIVSCDSMQIYRGLDVGTAKPTAEERARIPHHLIDIRDPEERFSVSDYVAEATAAIRDIEGRNRVPVLCGGTGLYYSSLVKGITFTEESAPDERVKAEVERELELCGPEKLVRELEQADPEHADAIERGNPKRLVRSVTLLRTTGMTVAQQTEASRKNAHPLDVIPFLLTYPDRKALYGRIDARVDLMMAEGLLEEAEKVYTNRERYRTAAAAIGYKEFFPYLEGRESLETCVEKLKQASRNYAKRQITWFRREPAHRILMDRDGKEIMDEMKRIIEQENGKGEEA